MWRWSLDLYLEDPDQEHIKNCMTNTVHEKLNVTRCFILWVFGRFTASCCYCSCGRVGRKHTRLVSVCCEEEEKKKETNHVPYRQLAHVKRTRHIQRQNQSPRDLKNTNHITLSSQLCLTHNDMKRRANAENTEKKKSFSHVSTMSQTLLNKPRWTIETQAFLPRPNHLSCYSYSFHRQIQSLYFNKS